MESTDKAVEIYELHIWIRKISFQIWLRRLTIKATWSMDQKIKSGMS
jgi:hypothetical protein